jgi:hypothetical protein
MESSGFIAWHSIYALASAVAFRDIAASGHNLVYARDVVSNSKGPFIGDFAVALELSEGESAIEYRASLRGAGNVFKTSDLNGHHRLLNPPGGAIVLLSLARKHY